MLWNAAIYTHNKPEENLYEEYLEDMLSLIESTEGYDIRDYIDKINTNTLVVSSEYDFVTPSNEQEYIKEKIKNSTYIMIKDSGHASMYEKPVEFLSILKGYLSIVNFTKIV